jgi:Lipocalin-like domain
MDEWVKKNELRALAIIVTVLLTLGVGNMEAQQNKATVMPLVGTWTLISVDNIKPDGSHTPRHGSHPSGLLIFDAQGRYSLVVLTEGTPEEYKAAIEGNNADYGRYSVNESEQSITFHMDHASHPELEGSSHTRYFTLIGDRLIYTTVKMSANGEAKSTYGEVVLERAK